MSLKDKLSNILAVVTTVITILYAAIEQVTAYLNTIPEGGEVDIWKVVIGIFTAVVLYFTGKTGNLKDSA